MILAAALLIVALGLIALGWITGRSFPARLAALMASRSRTRGIVAWAIGLFVTYGVSAFFALAILGRIDAIVTIPPPLSQAGRSLGLPGYADGATLALLGASMAMGAMLGVILLLLRRRSGKGAIGLRYRSPAAAEARGERVPAMLLALSASISEELFFRLLLPLLVAVVTGSGLAGITLGLAAFVMQHRHQGIGGMIAVTLIGAVLTALYLGTGLLWLAMLVHVAIDLNALILRPAIFPRRAGG